MNMLIDNKLSKFLPGPYIFIGFAFLVPGLFLLYSQQWIGTSFLLLIACFLLLTYSGVEINTAKKEFREYNCWFGVAKTGEWHTLDIYRGVTLVPINRISRMYSRANRINTSSEKEFRIYLVNKSKKPTVLLKICKTYQQGQASLDELSLWLKIPVFSIKR